MTAAVLERAARGDALSPAALTFLVRRYRATGQQDVCDVLGNALAVAIEQHGDDRATVDRAEWLRAFTEAMTVSDDARLADAARGVMALLAGAWPALSEVEGPALSEVEGAASATTRVAQAAAAVDACLFASHLVDPKDLVPRAIDELERIVAAAYRPGEDFGDLSDNVRAASALLTAFELTGRLPYSMLAEELMQGSHDRLFTADYEMSCEAARVLCRLARLHDDAEYRAAAVIKPGADYRADAERILAHASTSLDDPAIDPARYGLALDELDKSHHERDVSWRRALICFAAMPRDRSTLIPALTNVATQLRIDSLKSTSEAASGHPTSCCSMADLTAALFFAEMRFDPDNPGNPESDRFILSKGHAAPILYAAWAEAGAFDRAELLKLRQIGSDLEGHPTPRLPFVDVATGSLGQGICAAIGCALNARRIGSDYRTYVLLGDGESAEGSVWEAADMGATESLDNLCGITDVNALGQSRPTMWRHDMDQFARRWRAFGWHTIVIDGHDMNAILDAFEEARRTRGQPTMILARTLKGKGVSFVEGKDGWHGKAFKKGEELDRALAELEKQFVTMPAGADADLARQIQKPASARAGDGAQARAGSGLQAGRRSRDAGGVRHRDRQAWRGRRARRGARRRREELDVQ